MNTDSMKKECIRPKFYYENEQWVDHFIYVALPSDLGLVEKPPVITDDIYIKSE